MRIWDGIVALIKLKSHSRTSRVCERERSDVADTSTGSAADCARKQNVSRTSDLHCVIII